MRRYLPRALPLLIVSLFLISAKPSFTATITLDPTTTYQTITGWEASIGGAAQCVTFPLFKDDVYQQAVNDLGINRVRLGVRSGMENTVDYGALYENGQIPYRPPSPNPNNEKSWRCVRYATVNDNNDPNTINWSGFHFGNLDSTVEDTVVPLQQKLRARGEELYINLLYTAFTNQIVEPDCATDLSYHHVDTVNDPQFAEYAEFILASFLHLKNKYGWVPDAVEIILEPDNSTHWRSGQRVGQALAAAAQKLAAASFHPDFIAPSNTNMSNAISYFDAMVNVPQVTNYLTEFSYHRYGGVSDANLLAIANRARQYNLKTAMLEHIGSPYQDLHQDLEIANNTAWQQFTLAYCAADNGGAYYWINETNPSNPVVNMGSRTKLLRQYFKWVRPGARRIGANSTNAVFDPLAFVNTDGKFVIVVKATSGGSFSNQGLPAGSYGITYTTDGNLNGLVDATDQYNISQPDQILNAGQLLTTNIPTAGVITIYAKTPGSPPPTPTPTVRPTASPTPSAVPSPTPTATTTNPADLDRDGDVDVFDYNILVANFGRAGANTADIDRNGMVDISDYSILVTNFGR